MRIINDVLKNYQGIFFSRKALQSSTLTLPLRGDQLLTLADGLYEDHVVFIYHIHIDNPPAWEVLFLTMA